MSNEKLDWTQVNCNANGHPRYVVHFLSLLTDEEKNGDMFPNDLGRITNMYKFALNRARSIPGNGGKKFHNKQYGGGIVFVSFDIEETEQKILSLLAEVESKEQIT